MRPTQENQPHMARRFRAVSLFVSAFLICAARPSFPEPPPRTISVADKDSTPAAAIPVTTSAHAAYEDAWARRQAGDFEAAARMAETAMKQIEDALALDPDMTTRRDLTDLRSRISGLRDASRHDLESAEHAKASGNEADDKVLNAPAGDAIEAQMNPDVMRWVDFFTGAGRSTFERW